MTFAGLLFPNIIHLHGVAVSLIYTGLGAGFIWFLYFAMGRFLQGAVADELRQRGINLIERNGRVDEASKVR